MGISWPTYGFIFFLFFALVPLIYLLNSLNESKTKHKLVFVFLYSYLTFFIWNLMTTWWIINSSLFGAIFAIICNSSFYSIIICIYFWSLNRLPKTSSSLFLICLWISFEKFHLNWEFTWPWLNLGNAFSENTQIIQWYEYTGIFGGSLWILVINFTFFNLVKIYLKSKDLKLCLKKSIPTSILITFPIIISFLIYINLDIPENKIKISLLQPNIDPYEEKYFTTNIDNLELLKKMTEKEIDDKTEYLIAPETFFSQGNGEDISDLNNTVFKDSVNNFLMKFPKLNFISGIQLYEVTNSKLAPSKSSTEIKDDFWVDIFNSAIQFNLDKKHQIYHKSKFVPGVEIMPYKSFFKPLIGEFMINLGGTVSGRTPQKNRLVFKNPNNRIYTAPIICYESIYGSFVTEFTRNGAEFLTIISNDGWWGDTQGHKQLLSLSRLRAIENRRAIARSANTGISAFINIYGEIEKQINYEKAGVLTNKLNLNNKITFYVKYQDYIARISFLLILILFSISLSGRLKTKNIIKTN